MRCFSHRYFVTLSVTGAVTLSNALTVAGTLTASGDAYVVGQIYMDGVPLSNNNGVLQWNGVEVSSTTGDSSFLYVDADDNLKFGPATQLFTQGQAGLRQNVSIGASSMMNATTADGNTAVGHNTLTALTTGPGNSAFGNGALNKLIDNGGNTAIGHPALFNSTSGDGNTCNALLSVSLEMFIEK